jgi:probable rRNA maturation factor
MLVDVQNAVAHDPSKTALNDIDDEVAEWARAVMCAVSGHAADGGVHAAGAEPEVCIRLVEEEESRELNARYRGQDKSTNVLSFPAEIADEVGVLLLGDIVICAPVVAREAEEQGKTFADHLNHMVVHGMLHLLGYDHERDEKSRLEMEALEREVLGRFGVSDPYRET